MDELNKQIEQFTEELAKNNIKAEEITHITGPQVITYRFELTDGYTPEQFSKDIEKIEPKARIVPIENTNYVYVEVPSICRQMVWLKDLLKSPEFKKSPYNSPIILGLDTQGKPVCYDFDNMPGLLIAGGNGCGKTQFMYSIALSLMEKHNHEECRFMIFDTKGSDFYHFDWSSHILVPVKTSAERITGLRGVERDVLERHQLLIENKQDEIKDYRRLVVIIDEYSELLKVHGKEFEDFITRILSKAQGTKVHIIMGTRLSAKDTMLDSFKEAFPCKAYFNMGAEPESKNLIECGDMLFMDRDKQTVRIHTPFIFETDLKAFFLKEGAKSATKKLLEMAFHCETPLHVIKDLIDNGADVNAKLEWGEPLLHWVRDPHIIQALIDAGADVDIRDDHKVTPLMENSDMECIKVLLKNGANVHMVDDMGHDALWYHSHEPEIQMLLLEHGAKLSKESYLYKIVTNKKLRKKIKGAVQ